MQKYLLLCWAVADWEWDGVFLATKDTSLHKKGMLTARMSLSSITYFLLMTMASHLHNVYVTSVWYPGDVL